MGQVLSADFFEKRVLFPTEPKRKRRRKYRKENENVWARIKSFLSRLLSGHPTQGQMPEITLGPKEKNKQELDLINGDIGATKVDKFCSEHYDHILCNHGRDKFTPVISFLVGKELFKSVEVPGKKSKLKVSREILRRLLIGILVRFQQLHSDGKTLNGCFTVENICVPVYKKEEDIYVRPYINVKFDTLDLQSFKPYTDDGADKDLKSGFILRHNIFSSETEFPSDLNQLLELLQNNPIQNKDLIYDHMSLKGPRDQVSHFLWLYKGLMYLKKKVPLKYKNIMQKITKNIMRAEKGWRPMAKQNRFLAKLRPYAIGPKGGYSPDAIGLSRFYRNSVEHLFHLFEDDNSKSVSMVEEEQELQDYHIIYILTDAFPEFLVDLQKAFHEEDGLQNLKIIQDPLLLQNVVRNVASAPVDQKTLE